LFRRQNLKTFKPQHLLLACPICVSPEGTAITDGMRAGAGVLMLVTVIVIGLIVRFGYRLWAAERTRRATEGTEGSEVLVTNE
jgi:hypothetical protein